MSITWHNGSTKDGHLSVFCIFTTLNRLKINLTKPNVSNVELTTITPAPVNTPNICRMTKMVTF